MSASTKIPRNERGRITNVPACKLDWDALAEVITKALNEAGQVHVSQRDVDPLSAVLLLSKSGDKFAVVNSEGVGSYEVDGMVTVWYSYGFGFEVYSVEVPVAELERIDTEHQVVELSEFIRVFGNRLDRNNNLWGYWYHIN